MSKSTLDLAAPDHLRASRELTSANLDLLRAIAVLTVMIDHLMPTLHHHGVAVPEALLAFTDHIGQAGVLAFFVHTSLVLMYSLERLAAQPGGSLTARFYVRRLFRIYPLAVVVILAVVVLGLPDATWREPVANSPEAVAANLMLVQNVATGHSVLVPLWSLPYEVEMYLVLPALFFLARRVNGARWIAGLFATACLGGYAIAELANGHMNLAAYVPCFLAGVLAYSLRNRIRADLLPGSRWGLFVVGLIVAYCLADLDQDRPVYWIGWVYCLVLGLSINQFADSRNRWLNRAAARIAEWSYGLYLLHVPVLYLVYDVWRPGSVTLGVLGYVAISAVAAAAAFRLIETPLMNVGRRLSDGRRG